MLYQILAYTTDGKSLKNHIKAINLKYLDQHGMKNLNYLMVCVLYLIFRIILSISLKNMENWPICQGYTEFGICANNSWICLNMPDYVWICQNMSEYVGICVNMPKSVWVTFVLPFPISKFFYNPVSTWTYGYLFEHLQETRGYSL